MASIWLENNKPQFKKQAKEYTLDAGGKFILKFIEFR